MAADPGGVYREPMSWVRTARDWRPTVHALAGLAAGALTAVSFGGSSSAGWPRSGALSPDRSAAAS